MKLIFWVLFHYIRVREMYIMSLPPSIAYIVDRPQQSTWSYTHQTTGGSYDLHCYR